MSVGVGSQILLDTFGAATGVSGCCYCVVTQTFPADTVPEVPDWDLRFERSGWLGSSGRSLSVASQVRTRLRFLVGFRNGIRRICREIELALVAGGFDAILVVLDCPVTIAIAASLDTKGAPLLGLIWDPPAWVSLQSHYDRWSRGEIVRDFQLCLGRMRRIAVVSEEMITRYKRFTPASWVVLRQGFPALRPTSQRPSLNSVVIGFAGSMYAPDAFFAMLRALDSCEWTIAGRPVEMRLFGPRFDLQSSGRARIHYLGYRSPPEVAQLLALCDVGYLPQPLRERERELCELAFPTKLGLYLSVGIPIFAHCPANSALASYLQRGGAGFCCPSLDGVAIIAGLEHLIMDLATLNGYRPAVWRSWEVDFAPGVFEASVRCLFFGDRSDGQIEVPGSNDV